MTRRPGTKQAAPSWTGHLQRTPDGIRGELRGPSVFVLTGIATGDRVDFWGDQTDGARRHIKGSITRDGSAWTGDAETRDPLWVLDVTGTTTAPGHIELRGQG